MSDGFLPGVEGLCCLGGADRVVNRLLERRGGASQAEVGGKSGKVRIEAGGVDALDRFGDLKMKALPPRQAQFVVDRLADERMAKPADAHVLEKADLERLFQRVRHGCGVQASNRLEHG